MGTQPSISSAAAIPPRVADKPRRKWLYNPLPTQRAFHSDLRTPYKLFSGPVGSGKSHALCYEALALAHLNPGQLGLIGAPTYPMLRDSTLRTMFDVLAKEEIRYEHNRSENILTFPAPPFYGSQIICRSVDDYERLRGTNLAWFGLDELTYCPPEAWTRLLGRLRDLRARRRCGFGACTPNGFDWVYKLFIGEPAPSYKAYLASPRENRYVEATGLYDALQSSYDDQLYRQEVLGEYLNVRAGQAYYAFDRSQRRENISDQAEYNPRQPLCWSLDFNVNPMCSVIAQLDDQSTSIDVLSGRRAFHINVIDEIHLLNSNTVQACEEFVSHTEKYQRFGPLIVYVYGDASGSARKTAAGAATQSDWAVIRDYFRIHSNYRLSYKYKTSNPAIRDRVAALNGALCNSRGQRSCFVNPRCKQLIQDLDQVAWKPGSGQLDQTTDPMLTHISDALGYLVEAEMGMKSTAGYRNNQIV